MLPFCLNFFIFSFNWVKAESTVELFKLLFGWCFMSN